MMPHNALGSMAAMFDGVVFSLPTLEPQRERDRVGKIAGDRRG
jgi:hypothetical protein